MAVVEREVIKGGQPSIPEVHPEASQEGMAGDLRAAEERETPTAGPENLHGRRVRMPRRSSSPQNSSRSRAAVSTEMP